MRHLFPLSSLIVASDIHTLPGPDVFCFISEGTTVFFFRRLDLREPHQMLFI